MHTISKSFYTIKTKQNKAKLKKTKQSIIFQLNK